MQTQRLAIAKTRWSILFKEIIAVFSDNNTKLKNVELLKQVVHILTIGI